MTNIRNYIRTITFLLLANSPESSALPLSFALPVAENGKKIKEKKDTDHLT